MSDYNIRIADTSDAEEIQAIMYDAFTPLRDLGIDWPSVNASVSDVKKNIIDNTTFVLEIEGVNHIDNYSALPLGREKTN